MRFYVVLSALAGLALADLNQNLNANNMRDVQTAIPGSVNDNKIRDVQTAIPGSAGGITIHRPFRAALVVPRPPASVPLSFRGFSSEDQPSLPTQNWSAAGRSSDTDNFCTTRLYGRRGIRQEPVHEQHDLSDSQIMRYRPADAVH
ncbi:hypothetical protein E4U28_003003 [Claviceps purpurea]|nr:hypothetical protein E4U28_003003 [Claviceps purpurea]